MSTTTDLQQVIVAPANGSVAVPLTQPFQPEELASAIPTFLIEPTTIVQRWYRAFSRPRRGSCAVHGAWGHDIWVPIDQINVGGDPNAALSPRADIQRFPVPVSASNAIAEASKCVCGHRFDRHDFADFYQRRLYKAADSSLSSFGLFTLEEAPVGSINFLDWQQEFLGPDGHCIAIMTPEGWWGLDLPDINGNTWQRNSLLNIGPDIILTASPGVRIGKYSGALADGLLVPRVGN